MSTKATTLTIRIVSLAAGVIAAGALAWIVYAAGEESTAKGILIGAGAVVVAAVILWIRGRRGGAAARLASGEGDERERQIMTQAAADAAFAMLVTGVVAMIGAIFGWPAMAVAAIVLWTGLATIAVSFVIRTRRG